MGARFSLGQTVATPGALEILTAAGTSPLALLVRHKSGDWGDVPAEDAKENELSIEKGFRVLSSYPVGSEHLWVITEADRSVTTILRPDEYLKGDATMNGLVVHAGARRIGRQDLPAIVTPAATDTHRPIPHATLAESILESLAYRQLEVIRDEYAVTPDGMRLFGFLEVNIEHAGVRLALVFRNSHDKSFSLGLLAGYRTFCCDNLAFHGEFIAIAKKHTKNVNLQEVVGVGVAKSNGISKESPRRWTPGAATNCRTRTPRRSSTTPSSPAGWTCPSAWRRTFTDSTSSRSTRSSSRGRSTACRTHSRQRSKRLNRFGSWRRQPGWRRSWRGTSSRALRRRRHARHRNSAAEDHRGNRIQSGIRCGHADDRQFRCRPRRRRRRSGGLRSRQPNERRCHMTIKIAPNDKGNPPGKLADAELHFTDGPLAGLKLIGFAVWERRGGTGRNITFPARQYAVNGERRSFALLRPIADAGAQSAIRDLILDAYAHYEESHPASA